MELRIPRPKFLLPVVILGAVVVLIRANPFTYVTQPGQATVIFNSLRGLQQDRINRPGLAFLLPFIDRPIPYNIRTRVWAFSNDSTITNQAGTAITVNSADGQAFTLDVYVALRPNPDTLDDLHGQIGQNYMNTVVVPVVRSKIRDISAEFDSEDFYQREQRNKIEQSAQTLISREMPTASHQGQDIPLVVIEGIFLGTPDFPQALKDSIERKQVASITAQTAAVKAEIQTKETQRSLILAKANQAAIEQKGKAAAANAKLADLLFFEKLETRINQAQRAQQQPPLTIMRVEGKDATVFLNVNPQQAELLNREQASPQ